MEPLIQAYSTALKAHLEAQASYLKTSQKLQKTRYALLKAKQALHYYEVDALELSTSKLDASKL